MAIHRLFCPGCHCRLDIAEELFGRKALCEDCGSKFIIADPPVIVPPDIDPPDKQAAAKPAAKPVGIPHKRAGRVPGRSDKKGRRGAFTLGVALIALSAGGLYWWQQRSGGIQADGQMGWTVPAADPIGLPTEALAFWLKADQGMETSADGLLLGWQDGASEKNRAAPFDAPVFNAKGIGGKPGIVFNRTNPLKIDLGEKWPTEELAIFAVARCSEPQKGENNLFQVFPAQNGNLFQAHLPHQNGNAYWDVGGNRTFFKCADGAQPQIWELTAKPGTGQAMFCNGIQKAVVKTTGKFDPTGKQLHLGRAFQGELAELIVCNRAPDEAARNRIGAYLAKKHGITSAYQSAPSVDSGAPAIADNVLWLKADAGLRQDAAGNVLVWEDQSPCKHHAVLPTLPKRIESAPGNVAVRFSGTQKLSAALPASWPTKDMNIFLVIRRAKEKPGIGSLLAITPVDKDPFAVGVPSQDGEIRWSVGRHNFLANCANPGTPQIIECSASAGKGKIISIDGTQCATSLVDSTLVLGARKLVIGEGFNGDIAEIVVYRKALSPQERHQAGFHLAQKYNIAANYPRPHPVVAAAIDLKEAREISAIQAVFAGAATPIPYLIEGSVDGKLWHPIVDNRLAEIPAAAVHEFDPVTVRHLRLIPELKGNDKLPLLSEFRAFRQQEHPPGVTGTTPVAAVWPDAHPGLTVPQSNLLPDTHAWILAHNQRQVIDAKFLETAPVPTEILLPNGQVEPLQKIRQLFDFNFRVFHYPTGSYDTPENREILKVLSERYRRQLARPLLWEYVSNHAWYQQPAEGSQIYEAAVATYNRFRRATRQLPTFSYAMGAAGMSNGSNVALASWINFEISGWPFHIMTHETSHCLGFNDGCGFAYGFDGYMSGKFGAREWAYELVDPNQITLSELPKPPMPRLPTVPLGGMPPLEKLPPTACRSSAVADPPLSLNGVPFTSGVSLTSDTPVSFEIPQGAARFVAVAGIDDADKANTLAGCILEVYADASLIARSPQLAANTRRWWTIDAQIPAGAKALRLLARNTIDNRKDKALVPVQSAWCNAGFCFAPPQPTTAGPVLEQNPDCYAGTRLVREKLVDQVRYQIAYHPNGAKRWETAIRADGIWDGLHRQWFADGTPQVVETYRNGKLHGLRSEWYGNGKKCSEKSFTDGILNGTLSQWRDDGSLSMKFTCRDGKTEGRVRKFQPDGKTAQLQENHSKGILHGPKRSFHPNGKMAEEWSYLNGVQSGIHAKYDANGIKLFEETLAENQLQGTQTTWDPSGKKQIEASYKDNKLHGDRNAWHANGELAEKSFYTHGLQDGLHSKFYPTGAKQLEETFIKNQVHGRQSHWYADGKKYIEVNYKDNRMHGDRNVWHANGALAESSVYTNGLLDGPHAKFDIQGKKQLEETYVKNLLHGIKKTWHGNGSKYQEHSYRDGKLDGLRLDWFPDGKAQFEESYRYGVKSGRCRQWDAKGNVISDQVCEAKTDVPNGVKETKAANGTVTSSQTYENGLLHGKSRWFHANGKVSKEMTYVKGHIEGPYGEWYNTGTPYVACLYHDDLIDGERTVWHANGQVAEKALYSGNLLDGLQTTYDAGGKKQRESTYVKNLLHGPRTHWHPNGQKQIEEQYQDNLLTGKRLAWHANGKLQSEEYYLDGLKAGHCSQWDANGKLVSEKLFKKGKAQE